MVYFGHITTNKNAIAEFTTFTNMVIVVEGLNCKKKTAYSNARKSLASGAYQIQNKAKKVKYEELFALSVSAFANDLIYFIFVFQDLMIKFLF